MKRGFYIVLPLTLINCASTAVDLTSVNFRYKYNIEAPISVNTRLSKVDNLYQIIFDVSLLKKSDSLLGVDLYFQTDYDDDSDGANTPIRIDRPIKIKKGVFRYLHQFVPDSLSNLIVISVVHSGLITYYYDIPFSGNVNFDPPDFSLLTLDSLDAILPYAYDNKAFLFSESAIVIFQYEGNFPASSPPMTKKKIASKSLAMDSIFKFEHKFSPITDKLFCFQKDTNSLAGMSLLSVPQFYPKLISTVDLIKPLVYVSTLSEFDKLLITDNSKLALDRFWLDVTGLQSRAVETIKKFYRRVTESNQFFTSYKQGWKTDMGMIYILFGAPTRVNKTTFQEEWVYENLNGKAIQFSFNKIKNFFSPNHYELERKADYSDIWFRQVDLWRKGRI